MERAELELRNDETPCNGAAGPVAKKTNLLGLHFVHLGVLVHLWTEPLILQSTRLGDPIVLLLTQVLFTTGI
jgi:hypothetical protein